MGLFKRIAEKDRKDALRYWEEEGSATVERLSREETPLNDHFAEGKSVTQDAILRHIAALERRIARLENE
jgi:hypothetical protein